MSLHITTPRLILRHFQPQYAEGIFQLDTNPLVHRYLGNNPISTMQQAKEVVSFIISQYASFGIGRWAVIEQSTNTFIGWAGLKWITDTIDGKTNFHDIGYRLMPQWWGRGLATEATHAALTYAFTTMQLQQVVGICHIQNLASRRVLEKSGLTWQHTFHTAQDLPCHWLQISQSQWAALPQNQP